MLSILISPVQAKTVKVVVLDSGYSSQKILKKYVKKSFNFTDDKIDDLDGHASNVMGIIVDVGNLDPKKVEIIPIKIIAGSKWDMLSYVNALKKAVDLNPDIINISMTHDGESVLEEFFLKQAKDKGIKVVVAAGNAGLNLDETPRYPCSYDLSNVFCVGNEKKQSNSNYGKRVSIQENGDLQIGFGINGEGISMMSGSSQSTAIYTRRLILEKISGH